MKGALYQLSYPPLGIILARGPLVLKCELLAALRVQSPAVNDKEQVRVEQTGAEVTLTVEVPGEAIRKKEDELLRSVAREIEVPGFRPGRAPRHLLLAHYGEEAFLVDLREALVREWLRRSLGEAALTPVTTPRVEEMDFQPHQRFAFRVRFEVLPELGIPDEVELRIPEPPPAQVTEEEVAEVLEAMRRQAAVLEPKTGPAEEGDVVHIRRGDQVWEAEASAGRHLGRQLIGATVGGHLVLRDEGGEASEFEVMGVYRVLIPDPPEVASHFGKDSWDALREEVRAGLLQRAEADRLRVHRLAALDALAEALGLEPPPGLLSETTEEELRRLGLGKGARGEVEAAVRRRLRREIVARHIAHQKGILPEREEVERLAREREEEEGVVRGELILTRAADWIIARARREG